MAKLKHIFLAFICVIVGSLVFTGCNFSDNGNYSITVNQNEHGTVTVDKTTAKENEKVTITATADEGYVLYALLCDGTVLDSNIVTMPAKNIVVSAIFEQVSDQTIVLGKGNYVQLAYVDEDGIYSENGTFFNSISIKDNNKLDLILSLDTLVELNDVGYTQSGNTIIAKVGERNYSVKIIDEKTFMFRNISSDGYLGSMIIFGYQEDKPLGVGNYSEKIGDAQYEINIKENNKLDLIKLAADYTISLDKQDLPYFVKGNTLYIDLGDEYICAKLGNVSTGVFIATNIVNVTKEDGDFSYIHKDNATFTTIYGMSVGTYVANQSANADKDESEYKYNAFKFDGDVFTIAMQTSAGYKVYQNLPFKQIGNVYIIGDDEQTKIVMEYNYGPVVMRISATSSIVYECKTDAFDAIYSDGHYSYEENGNAVEYTYEAGKMSIYAFMNGESVTIEGGKLYSIGNLTIVLGGTSAIVWLQEDASFGLIWTSYMVSFNETGTMTDLTNGTNIMTSEVQGTM